jgi:hypothetical protein
MLHEASIFGSRQIWQRERERDRETERTGEERAGIHNS